MDTIDDKCQVPIVYEMNDTYTISEIFQVQCKSEPIDNLETEPSYELHSQIEFGEIKIKEPDNRPLLEPEGIEPGEVKNSITKNDFSSECETEISDQECQSNKTKIRKIKRNSGLAYVTKNGKIIKKRKSKELENCKKQCRKKIKNELREKCFTDYWSLGTYSERLAYASKRIQIDKKSRITNLKLPKKQRNFSCKYFVIDDEQQFIDVCKRCFLSIYDETHGFISSIIKKSTTGLDLTDYRGQFAPVKKITNQQKFDIVSHIKSFPAYKSHYARDYTKILYLAEGLNLTKMYDLYQEKFHTSKVSYTKYREMFNTLNLKFNKQLDKCSKCHRFDVQLKVEQSQDKKDDFIYQRRMHQVCVEIAYKMTQLDKDDMKKTVLFVDLQPCLPTPYLKCSTDFYKRKIWTFYLTIRNCNDNNTHCYIWNETISGRDENQVASCILKYLTNSSSLKSHVVIYSDTCSGQIRNSIVATMFQYLMTTNINFEILEHKFLEPNHTHLECDSDRIVVERKIKSCNILLSHPHDWAQLLRSCEGKQKFIVYEMKLEDFLDFTKLQKQYFKTPLKNQQNQKIKWNNIRVLRYTKGNCHYISYKTSYKETCFKTMVTKKTGNPHFKMQQINSIYLPISDQKKADLLDLLQFIPLVFHNYYRELKTKSNMDELCYVEEESDCDEKHA